ncbi:MAG TPA: fibronectin type III domain-containing protein [Mycobacteriales bacterium]|nr:fibronectin type III domain-containing protein [Mycobacteriales bacterium]
MGPRKYLITTIVGSAGTATLLLALTASSADAAPTVTCSAAAGTVTVTLSGTATGSDGLRITTSGGDYVISLNGGAVCTGQSWSDTADPTIQVTGSTQVQVPATFAPGADGSVSFLGNPLATNIVDLSGQGSSTVHLGGAAYSTATSTVSWSALSDSFSGVATVVGASSGGTDFVAGSGGGWTLSGLGAGNVLDLSASTTSPTANLASGTAQVGPSATDSISDISTVVGSQSVGTTFVAGGSSATFVDPRSAGTGSTVDFSQVPTSGGTQMVLNLSGAPAGAGTPAHSATVGATTYSFSSGAARFTGFVGPSTGFTDVVADATTGWSFAGSGAGNSLDLSGSSSATIVDLAGGTVQIGSGFDSITGVNTATGSNFARTTFVAGAGSETFLDPNALETIDFSQVAATAGTPLRINLASSPVAGVASRTATQNGITYTFTSGSPAKTTVVGASNGNTSVYADSTTGYTITEQGGGNVLDLSNAFGAVRVDVPHDSVQIGATTDTVSGLNTVVGSASGQTVFVADNAGGNTFQGLGSNNTLDLSSIGAGPIADLATGTAVVGASAIDAFSGITSVIGSGAGGTTFVAGSGSESFADHGSTGGDSIDFSSVATSGTAALVVNVSGVPQGSVANDTAAAGASTYSFTSGGGLFTTFKGAASAYTQFGAGSVGGYTFRGQGHANTLNLSAAPADPVVDLAQGTAQVANAAADTISGITTVVGSAAGGTTYTAAPQANETFVDPSSSGPFATLDLSQLGSSSAHPLIVNLTGGPADGVASSTATDDGYIYDFTQGANRFRTVDGPAAGQASFLADTTARNFVAGGSGNILDLNAVPWQLTINADSGQVTSVNDGTFTDTFSGMQTLVGSSGGGTHFVAGSAGGFDFQGLGASNVLDFHPTTSGPTVNAALGQADLGASNADTFAGITNFVGSSAGNTRFVAGPAPGLTFQGVGTGNSIDFSQVANGLSVDLSTGAVQFSPSGSDVLSGIQAISGTPVDDTFTQGSPGSFDVAGGGGVDTLDLTSGPATVTETNGDPACSGATHDGTATGSGLNDRFECLSNVLFTGAPANPIATGAVAQKDGVLAVTWTAPTDTGGSAITGYDVYCSTSPNPTVTGSPTVAGIAAGAPSTSVTGLTSGTRYYCIVTASNANGESPASSVVGAVADATAPKVSVTSPTSRFDLTPHAKTTYTATDTSGVSSYDVRYRMAKWNGRFGSWTYPQAWQATTKKSETLSIAAGSELCFEVRARDFPGNTSTWSSQRCTARPLDDRGLATATKGWTRGHDRYAYLGTVTSTTTKGATLKATGAHFRYLALVVTKCATCGHVAIYLNGHYWKTVSTYAAHTRHQVLLVEARTRVVVETVTLKATDVRKHVIVDGLGCSQ